MDIKVVVNKCKTAIGKYKYACLVLLIGLSLLLIPGRESNHTEPIRSQPADTQGIDAEKLSEILQTIEGAGRVQVMLSVASGEKTLYQTDQDISGSDGNKSSKIETVIVTDSQRNETGLISQLNPPTYLGAIVVCQGADSPAVKLAVLQAVAKITGLGADHICVLKMK